MVILQTILSMPFKKFGGDNSYTDWGIFRHLHANVGGGTHPLDHCGVLPHTLELITGLSSYNLTIYYTSLVRGNWTSKVLLVDAIKVYRGRRGTSPLILNIVITLTCGGKFTPRPLPHPKNYTGTHWTEGWASYTAGLDDCGAQEISCYCRDSNSGSSSPRESLKRLFSTGSHWRGKSMGGGRYSNPDFS